MRAVVLGMVAAGLVLAGCEASSGGEGSDAAADVSIKSCAVDEFGLAKAALFIKNSTGDPKSYLVTVSMNGPDGNRVAELNGAANSVGAGQTATVEALGTQPSSKVTKVTCKIANVSRF